NAFSPGTPLKPVSAYMLGKILEARLLTSFLRQKPHLNAHPNDGFQRTTANGLSHSFKAQCESQLARSSLRSLEIAGVNAPHRKGGQDTTGLANRHGRR